MKNKFTYLFIALLVNCFSLNTAYCQSIMTDCDYPMPNRDEYSDESAPVDNIDTYHAYRYGTVGVGPVIFIPNIGLGYRERFGQYGWDTAVSFSTIGYAHQLTAHLAGHYYFNSHLKNPFYLGLGLMGSGIITNHNDGGFTLSPDFIFGKEFEKENHGRHFLEMHVNIPTLWLGSHHRHSTFFPLMYIKYGFAF